MATAASQTNTGRHTEEADSMPADRFSVSNGGLGNSVQFAGVCNNNSNNKNALLNGSILSALHRPGFDCYHVSSNLRDVYLHTPDISFFWYHVHES